MKRLQKEKRRGKKEVKSKQRRQRRDDAGQRMAMEGKHVVHT